MEIKRKSWHYKIVKLWKNGKDFEVPTDLCRYVRTLVIAIGCIGFTISATAMLMSMIGMAGSIMFLTYTDYELVAVFPCWAYPILAVLGVVYLAIIIGLFVGFIYCLAYSIDYLSKKKDKSIFIKYISDKHNKMCTRITFK